MPAPTIPTPHPSGTCLITGASSGIGAAIARELAARGHGVTLVARRAARLEALARELSERHGVRAEAVSCDLTDPDALAQLPERVAALGLSVSVLVSNAGVATTGRFAELPPGPEIEQVDLLCRVTVALCSAFAPEMTARRSGAILVVSSSLAFSPAPNCATYAAAKAFSLFLGEALHYELRSGGVAVSTLCPGPVRTRLVEHHPSQRLPAPFWLSAETVARTAVDGLARNRRVVVPGRAMNALLAGGRLAPGALKLAALDRFYRAPSSIATGLAA